MSGTDLSFQQIIDSVSFDEIVSPCQPSQEKIMTVADQKRELAIMAGMIAKGHAGYETWDEQTRKEFEKAVADQYNRTTAPMDVKAFYQEFDKSLCILPDEHLKVSPSKGNLMPREPNDVSVGGNICRDKSKKWEISASADGKTGIIALPDLGSSSPSDWMAFSKELDEKLFRPDGSERYEALVIDIRNNPGGAAIPFEILAKKLYGNDVAPFEKSSYRDTKEADFLRFVNGEISRETFNDRIKNHEYTGKQVEICDYSSHEKDFPPFAKGGYKKPIAILTNRETCSAGESLCRFLRHHPGVSYIGENTAGCYAEISGEAFRGKFGYGVKIGSTHASFGKEGNFERKGFPVDIDTTGRDAFAFTMSHLKDIKEKAEKKLSGYKAPKSKKSFDKLANNDFAFIRAINSGMPKDQVKQLYETLYPDKKGNFQGVETYAEKGTFPKARPRTGFFRQIMAVKERSDSRILQARQAKKQRNA